MSHTPRIMECCEGVRNGLKRVEIGDWDMDSQDEVAVAHGFSGTGVISIITASIRNDTDTHRYTIVGKDSETLAAQIKDVTDTNVVLSRKVGQFFDGPDFDSTSYNRGWVSIWYRVGN